ncbi:hypothetical protein WS97_00605 [Burkholderia territorii]|nr:hypothetical protein WS97_00605 [Burkholderia territorii]
MGAAANSAGDQSVAIGASATSSGAGSVALGQGSSDGGASNVVSVGNASTGLTRTITNVSAGVNPTDAVNVSQLNASASSTLNQANAYTNTAAANTLNQANAYTDAAAANALTQANSYTNSTAANTLAAANSYTDQATKYFKANSTAPNAVASGADSVSIGPSSVASGSSAVAMGNGAQAVGNTSTSIGTDNVVSGDISGLMGAHSRLTGSGSYAVGNNNTVANNNTVVVGDGVTTTQDNSVVLGNSSTDRAAVTVKGGTINGTAYTYAGAAAPANGVVSVGSVGGERQVINVAAGQISATSTDAVNGSQLYATNQAVNTLGAVTNKLGTTTASALGGGATYNPATGAISAPTYTVQGQTYNNMGGAISGLDGAVTSIAQGHTGLVQTDGSTITVGKGDSATKIDVSGPAGNRVITGLAPGSAPNDAATVGQMQATGQQANAYTNQQIGAVTQKMNSLGAAAMAATSLIPNARAEGRFQMAVGAGTYGGQTAIAVGANWFAADRLLFNLHVTRATGGGGSFGASVGATYGF